MPRLWGMKRWEECGRRMPVRALLFGVVLLIAGAAISLAVAWLLVAGAEWEDGIARTDESWVWRGPVPPDWPLPGWSLTVTGPGWAMSGQRGWDLPSEGTVRYVTRGALAAGWPFKAWWLDFQSERLGVPGLEASADEGAVFDADGAGIIHGAVTLPWARAMGLPVWKRGPVRPLALGLVVDAMVYGLAIGLLVCGPRWSRGHVWRAARYVGIGLVASVAVAALGARWGPEGVVGYAVTRNPPPWLPELTTGSTLSVTRERYLGSTFDRWCEVPLAMAVRIRSRGASSPSTSCVGFQCSAGWPWRLVRMDVRIPAGAIVGQSVRETVWPAGRRGPAVTCQVAGVRVRWDGLAWDVLEIGGGLWLARILRLAFRWSRRARRGLCRGCAYPIGSSPVCTECGAALKAEWRERGGRFWAQVTWGACVFAMVSLAAIGAPLAGAVACSKWGARLGATVLMGPDASGVSVEGIALEEQGDSESKEALVVRFVGCEYAMVRRGGLAVRGAYGQWGAGVRCEAGWPWKCWVIVVAAPYGVWEGGGARSALWPPDRFLPRVAGDITVSRPLWGGLMSEAAIAATVVLMVWGTVMTTVRAWRRLRGSGETLGRSSSGLGVGDSGGWKGRRSQGGDCDQNPIGPR
jgi:hypothetical protein